MDAQRAGELLARERARIEQEIAALEREGPLEASDRKVPGDEESEDLYQDEMNLGRAEDLRQQLDSVARAIQPVSVSLWLRADR